MAESIHQSPQPAPILRLIAERSALLIGGGESDALLHFGVDAVAAAETTPHTPLTLSLVVDRSGSMSGAPLAYAKRAALHALNLLRPGDAVAVVAFDDEVDIVVPTTLVDGDLNRIQNAIQSIDAGGSTGLHAGWVEGLTQALMFPREIGFARVILLSDGGANRGITDARQIAEQVAQASRDTGVSTSAIGLGSHYDEALMRAIADAGGGTYSYVSEPQELVELFETELVSITAVYGRKARLTFNGAGAQFIGSGPGSELVGGTLHIGDLLVGMPREVLVRIAYDGAPLPPLRLDYDDVASGQRVGRELPLDIPFIDAASWAALPVTPEVVEARNLNRFNEQVARFELAVAERDFPLATRVIADLGSEMSDLLPNAKTDARLEDLHEMLTAAQQRDEARARKLAHRGRYEAERGFGRFEQKQMLAADRTRRGEGGLALKPYPLPPQSDVSFEVRGPAGSHRLELVVGDITREAVDAIVNPSNRGLFGTSGVDGAVHATGGPELTAACRQIGGIQYGEAVFTPGFRLPAKHVIHVATLVWADGNSGEIESLQQSYTRALHLAGRLRCRSITFPAIGTGTNGFPFDTAAAAAIATVTDVLQQHGGPEQVRFILSNGAHAQRYRLLLAKRLTVGANDAPRTLS